MLFHEPEPGPEPLHLFPRRADPLAELLILSFENAEPVADLLQFGGSVRGSPRLPVSLLGQFLLRLEGTAPPGGEFGLDPFEKPFQPLEGGGVRPCVG